MPVPCPCCFVDSCFRKYTPTKAPKPISTILHTATTFDWEAMPQYATLQALAVLHRCLLFLLCLVFGSVIKNVRIIQQVAER